MRWGWGWWLGLACSWLYFSGSGRSVCLAGPVSATGDSRRSDSSVAAQEGEFDTDQTRKLLGESVVTSVSVIMDHGNGTKTYLPGGKQSLSVVGTPGTLLAPDRYEFYSFNEEGELVKKLMSVDQIQSLLAATGDELESGGTGEDELEPVAGAAGAGGGAAQVYYPQPLIDSSSQSEGVSQVLQSVQNLLKAELEAAQRRPKPPQIHPPPPPLPQHSWSVLLPGLINADVNYKVPPLPFSQAATTLPTISNDLQSTEAPTTTTSQRRPVITTQNHMKPIDWTSTKNTLPTRTTPPSRPTIQSTTLNRITPSPVHSTVAQKFQSTQNITRPITTTYSPSTTYQQVTKKPSQNPPPSATKRPFVSTKKPYVSTSPFAKIPLLNATKPYMTTTKTTTPTTTKKPVLTEERTPSTKIPPLTQKKPVPEKQKPSGIPTIVHYLPLSSSSPSDENFTRTTQGHQDIPTTAQPVITSEKTKVPSTTPTTIKPTATTTQFHTQIAQKLVQTTKKPIQTNTFSRLNTTTSNRISASTQKPSTSNLVKKPVRTTTTAPPNMTRITTATNVNTIRQTTVTTTRDKPASISNRPSAESNTTPYQLLISTTAKPLTATSSSPQKTVLTKKPEIIKPVSNLISQSSNIVSSKVKPSQATTPQTRPTTVTTKPPEKLTTFSYTSKLSSNGEIVTSTFPTETSHKKIIASESFVSNTSTQKYNRPPSSTTEKSSERPTQGPHESASIKVTSSSAPVHKPTTYHPPPPNFISTSKKPQSQNTTPNLSTVPADHQASSQAQKLSATLPNLEQTTSVETSMRPITTQPIKQTSQVSSEGTTNSITTLSTNQETTIVDEPTTFSTEEMPLQEIPLKIYETLQDHVLGPQSLLTTIMSGNEPTTTGKIQTVLTTLDSALGSTVPITDRITTLTTNPESGSTLTPDSTKGTSSKPEITTLPITEKNNKITFKNASVSENRPSTEQYDNSKGNETTSPADVTTSPPDITSTAEMKETETTPTVEATTMYKDRVMQEGISAVANILLDQAEREGAIKEAMMVTALNNNDEPLLSKLKTTTNPDEGSTTVANNLEGQTGQTKPEVRLNEDTELLENVTTQRVETTTTRDEPTTTTTTTSKPKIIENNTEVMSTIANKTDQVPSGALPTKVSKLNPESDLHEEMIKINQDLFTTEQTIPVRTTPHPEIKLTTESNKVRIGEFQEKSVPKPTGQLKKPNPAFGPLESLQPPAAIELHPAPYESMGLESSIAFLGEDVRRFADLCNELAFKMWSSLTGKGQISARSLVMSPFAVTSLLAMVFLGARGPTSGQMNDVLRLDDMVTFNPHQVLQNVTESVINSKNYGVATAAFVRELYSDKSKGKILDFYKERVQQYYQGHVEEVTFSMIGDIIRRRTNLLVKRQTGGRVGEYLRGSSLNMRPPLAAFSANIFQTDCEEGSTDGRDGEMYFVVRPSSRQRRLVPVPAVVWRSGFVAGYEPSLDATAVSLGTAESPVSTVLILPGQQGQVAPGDGLTRLEHRLIETSYRRGGWSRLLRSLLPRPGLELQVPRFSHRSVLNITGALQRMGLRDLFNDRADLKGLNGHSNDLHLSDMLQVNTFSTCGEETIGARHHVETYPASPQRMGRTRQQHQPHQQGDPAAILQETTSDGSESPTLLPPPPRGRSRQSRLSAADSPRLRFDRPFLYLVRHNPTGMILHMGRFNPRLLP